MQLTGPLDAFAAGNLANEERRVQPAIAPGDHDAFVGLNTLARALDHVDVNDDRVARGEVGNRLVRAQPSNLFLLDLLDQVHVYSPSNSVSWPDATGPDARTVSAPGPGSAAIARSARDPRTAAPGVPTVLATIRAAYIGARPDVRR